ncbi:MAG: enoyl-CoA hydratase/isomerase family protein [Planctomycetota bacterium]|nr:enoyl-CoA hydratase/isomerase family protein [Planctomycetota bacterium]MDA0932013.1 enoyl-CoA hydratase/isomerase family protein [Planctomycetota bacterium]MDA1220426.1 enoyl-CoA hydratase/isomerase family protein [Planctomycetota bacterium]
MTEALVRSEKHGRIAVFTLCDPPANTYSYEMMRALDACILDARMDPEVDVIVLTGSGERFFCAGANIEMLNRVDPTWKYWFCLHANETLSRLEQTPKLVIAALNGHCVGGGLEVALACDLRIARRSCGKVGLPEVKLGVLPGTGGTQRLVRVVGKAKAIELMATGSNLDVDEAAALGLVQQVIDCEPGAFLEQVLAYAAKFTTPDAASMAIGHIKRAVQSGAEIPLEQGLALERELQAKLFASADAREGLAAFQEKRAPRFEGR